MDVDAPFLDTVAGEISFFRSITRSRPVGLHRHFHVLSIQQNIKRDTGVNVSFEALWTKLESCYDLEALEGLEIGGYESSDSDASQPRSIPSPVPGENLSGHPHFRNEFQLPWAEFDPIIAVRRASESSPPPGTPGFATTTTRRKAKEKAAQLPSEPAPSRRGSLMAGLVGGDSDSSALTESGDERADVDIGSAKPSRRNSVITGTPTESAEEEEEDGQPPGFPVTSSRGRRGRRRGTPASRRATASSRRTTRRR